MSYILDALRRADSERERERSAVPGLHTQAVPVGAAEGETDAPSNPWKWPIVAAFVALLGLVAWLWWGRGDVTEPVLPSASAPPPLVAPAAPPAVAPVAAAVAAPPAAVAAAATPAATAPAAASAAPAREPAPRKTPPGPTAAVRKPPASATAASAATAGVRPAAKASEPEVRISTLNELPDEIRRELPTIAVGGSIYSKSAANRMLVINGQVFHEGDELAPALVLEQIKPKAAVLKYKTYRYEITY